MGGYGALRNGLKYSETFGYVAGLSAANVAENVEQRTDGGWNFLESRSFAESFFGDLSQVKNSDRDIGWLAEEVVRTGKPMPQIYLACGTSDSLLPANRRLRDKFQAAGYSVTYREGPGAHEWDFWNRSIRDVLDWLPLSGEAGVNSDNVGI